LNTGRKFEVGEASLAAEIFGVFWRSPAILGWRDTTREDITTSNLSLTERERGLYSSTSPTVNHGNVRTVHFDNVNEQRASYLFVLSGKDEKEISLHEGNPVVCVE
jgi:hypothetical protein